MKIAFLILAHGNIPQLNCFLRQLLKYDGSYIYIHLDIKAGDVVSEIIKDERITVLPDRLSLNWGDYSLIEATDYLIRYAHEDGFFDWYSLHSGVDMAVRPVSEFADFLENDKKLFYASYKKLPLNGWGYKGGWGRICLYWPRFFRKKASRYSLRRFLRGAYGRLYERGFIKGKKLPEKYTFCGGSEWFTASNECIEKTLDFLDKNKDYDSIFKNAISSDEIYYNTIFNDIAEKSGADASTRNHQRFISWKKTEVKQKYIGGPNTMSKDFLNSILKSERFFARKFDINFDKEIVEYFEKNC